MKTNNAVMSAGKSENTNLWKLNEGHPPLDWNETVEVQFYDGDIATSKVQNFGWVDNGNPCNIMAWREVIVKDNEGWIENTGVQPVEDDVEVQVKFRDSYITSANAGDLRWNFAVAHETPTADIVEYKLSKPEISQPDSKYKSENTFDLYTTELSICAKGHNPIFGDIVTKVKLIDEGGGFFFEVIQEGSAHNAQEQQVIRLEFPEFKKLIQAVNILEVNAERFAKSE